MAGSAIRLASLNIASISDVEKILEMIRGIDEERIDILFLQEVEHASLVAQYSVREVAAQLGMHYVYAAEDVLKKSNARAMATFSVYPILTHERIRLPQFRRVFNPQARIALSATIRAPFGELFTFNVHLDTRINSSEREEQLAPVLELSAAIKSRQIIAGDFNSADILWVAHVLPLPFLGSQSKSVQEVMERQGFASPFHSTGQTFNPLPLKLDWVFLKGLESTSCGVKKVSHSDHRLLFVEAVHNTS